MSEREHAEQQRLADELRQRRHRAMDAAKVRRDHAEVDRIDNEIFELEVKAGIAD
ncbi:hypothetical protein [Mycobacteroides abscessus]